MIRIAYEAHSLFLLCIGALWIAEQSRERDHFVVHRNAKAQESEAKQLQRVKMFPPKGKRKYPHQQSSNRVQYHTMRRAHMLSDGNAEEIEEGNRKNVSHHGYGNDPVFTELRHSIRSILNWIA